MPQPRISIVIPALNESSFLERTLASCRRSDEIIVVDGRSSDDTPLIAEAWGALVLTSERGRASQMNRGARCASCEYLLFLHADTMLPRTYGQELIELLDRPGVVAGAFRFKIGDCPGRLLRLIETGANLRSRFLQLPYGDQGLFLKSSTFRQYGPFPEMPIMEDFEFVRMLRRHGKIALAGSAATTSARRWSGVGPLRTTLVNQMMILGYLVGWPLEKLAQFYRSKQRLNRR